MTSGGASFEMRPRALGRGKSTVPLATASPDRAGRRVTYARGPLVEWYEASDRGIEQGFDIADRPAGDGPLRIELDAPSFDGSSDVRFAYGELKAWDARGRSLRSAYGADGGAVALEIDDRDAVYPVVVDPLVWREHQALEGPQYIGGIILVQGSSAIISGDAILYDYERQGNQWVKAQSIAPSNAADSLFEAAMGGDTIAAIAIGDSGRVLYIFERTSGTWSEKLRFEQPDPNEFGWGWGLAASGDTVVVGAPFHGPFSPFGYSEGAAYVFVRNQAGAWSLGATLAGDSSSLRFGTAIALSGDTLAIAAASPYNDETTCATCPVPPGKVYFFTGARDTWTKKDVVGPPSGFQINPRTTASFGLGLALDVANGSALLAHPFNPRTDPPVGGEVFACRLEGGSFWPVQKLVPEPPDDEYLDSFGYGMAYISSRLLVGALGGNGGKGAAFLFDAQRGGFAQTDRFAASDGDLDDGFGSAVGMTDDMILIGAPAHAGLGKVYVYFHGSEGDPCTSGDACATGHCIDGVCCDSACGDGAPDSCMACSVAKGAAADGVCGPAKPRVCRPAKSDCDRPESCDGSDLTCPADLLAPNGLSCSGGTCSGGKCLAAIAFDASAPPPPASEVPPVAPPPSPADDASSCGCRSVPSRIPHPGAIAMACCLAAALRFRRARRR
jgi:hypothetical protein